MTKKSKLSSKPSSKSKSPSVKSKKPKVVLAYADAGSGHRSAAFALEQAFESNYPGEYEVKLVNLFKEADAAPLNTLDLSHQLISRNDTLQAIFAVGFHLTNNALGTSLVTFYFNSFVYRACRRVLAAEDADLIVGLHPQVCQVLERFKREAESLPSGKVPKIATVVSELVSVHRSWIPWNADLVSCGTVSGMERIMKMGTRVRKIIYPYFPIQPKLADFRDRKEILKELGFPENPKKPVILLTSGGVGGKQLQSVLAQLAKEDKYYLIAVTGDLDNLKRDLEQVYADNMQISILGYVNNMQDYINAADLVIGKPGPASILEFELFNKKAILTKNIGVQEVGGITYALENPNFRYLDGDYSLLEETVAELLAAEKVDFKPRRSFTESHEIVEHMAALLK